MRRFLIPQILIKRTYFSKGLRNVLLQYLENYKKALKHGNEIVIITGIDDAQPFNPYCLKSQIMIPKKSKTILRLHSYGCHRLLLYNVSQRSEKGRFSVGPAAILEVHFE